ncbi:MAG: type II secretion system protein GspK [Planctomycetota bacterium]|nr:type II secretion system protein GspK [Planctomycetota bacterium]
MKSANFNIRRGSVLVIVIWAVAIAAAIVGGLQILSFRQASLGNDAIARVQARWAARAGVETMIAIMEYHTENPDPDDALALILDLEDHSFGKLETGTYDIRHFLDGFEIAGPLDEHSKANINLLSSAELMNIEDMTPDVVGAIIDWRDGNEDAGMLGAEKTFYQNRGKSFEPRNANFRNFAEIELVAGVWPDLTREEDWNLNGRIDPNEDDGEQTWPEDNPDGILNAGWSDVLTASSRTSPRAASGEDRLNLAIATSEEVVERLGVTATQASALLAYAKTPNARLEQLLVLPLSTLSQGGASNASGSPRFSGGAGSKSSDDSAAQGRTGRSSGGRTATTGGVTQAGPANLDVATIGRVMNECTLKEFIRPEPGKMNVNTVSGRVLKEVFDMNPKLVDSLLSRRDAKVTGLTSLAAVLDIPGMTPQILSSLASKLDVQSFVFTITSRGRSVTVGGESEIMVTVDRSTLPAQILMYREP